MREKLLKFHDLHTSKLACLWKVAFAKEWMILGICLLLNIEKNYQVSKSFEIAGDLRSSLQRWNIWWLEVWTMILFIFILSKKLDGKWFVVGLRGRQKRWKRDEVRRNIISFSSVIFKLNTVKSKIWISNLIICFLFMWCWMNGGQFVT